MIKGVLFDKDGTLFDFNATWGAWTLTLLKSEAGGDQAVVHELANVLGYDIEAKRFLPGSMVIASTMGELADAILTVIESDRAALIERLSTVTASVPQLEPVPLAPLLSSMKQEGLKLGVATNDAEAPARAHLRGAGVEDLFDFIAGYDSGFGGKPAPGQMHGFLDAVDLTASECVMVGDSLHDVHAGRAAGMRTVGVLTGPAPREELALHADVVLQTIANLPDWIASQP